jgi:hypothetical protein
MVSLKKSVDYTRDFIIIEFQKNPFFGRALEKRENS